ALVIGISKDELKAWVSGYEDDPHYRAVLDAFRKDDPEASMFPQYHLGDEGLIYFEDWNGASRLCVPVCRRLEVMRQSHDEKVEGAH
ncbi:hypothetical protein OH77DRAFT_1382331, partial [Trametes cingulata]